MFSRQGFWSSQPEAQGTSWLELLVFFEFLGGRLVHFDSHGRPIPLEASGKPLRMCVVLFKQQFRLVVDTCLDLGDRTLFVPSRSAFCRLSSVCYTNFVACISAHVQVPHGMHDRVLAALLSCRFALTSSKRTAISRSLLY